MEISSITIQNHPAPEAKVAATAEVVLNGSLSLRGIKILRGRYGLFLAFPGLRSGSLQPAFETLSMRFRKDLQAAVLEAYRAQTALPLFQGCAA